MNRRQFLASFASLAALPEKRKHMSTINQPDTLSSIVRELERRIRILETAQRVNAPAVTSSLTTAAVSAAGVGRILSSHSTNVVALAPPVMDAYTTGGFETWIDDNGNTGSGYAKVTVTTGSRALIIVTCNPAQMANAATFVCDSMLFGAVVNAEVTVPQAIGPLINTSLEVDVPMIWTRVRNDLTPGSNTFKVIAKFFTLNGAAAITPRMSATNITVIPID